MTSGFPYVTRINCGCGNCIPFRVKVEKDDGSLRIGKLVLAANCHLILLVFGFCFLLAGAILTALAYKTQQIPPQIYHEETGQSIRRNFQESDSSASDEEKVAGPLFVIVGSCLVFLGVSLALLGYKLNREAKRQRAALNRFALDSPLNNGRSPDFHSEFFSSAFANLDDIRSQGGESNGGRSRRGSFFGNSFNNNTRRSTLTTIAQAVPVGFFMSDSPRTPKTPNSPRPDDPNNFQEIELSSPTKVAKETNSPSRTDSVDDDFNLPALSLRPSLPIPMFIMPNMLNNRGIAPLDARGLVVSSRSDEPFGSIVSLSGTGDIACFPVHHNVPPVTLTVPESEEESQVTNSTTPEGSLRAANNSHAISELPPIKVNEMGNRLTATEKLPSGHGRPLLTRTSKSEDCSTSSADESHSIDVRRGSDI